MKNVTITTDGACNPNPGKGGWAAVLRYGEAVKIISGGEPGTTNNRMEFRAILEAFRLLREPCAVLLRTDSKTALAWARPDSFKTERKRAKNPNVWPMVQEFRALAEKHVVTSEWVRGHNGDPDNELCDRIAEDEARKPF